MTPFRKEVVSPEAVEAVRQDLLSKPREFYTDFFCGRCPTEAEKLALIEHSVERIAKAPIYRNSLYTVQIDELPPFIHLNIHRNDWAACTDWRHFQQIKNELVGVENEAMELFPAESRLMDTANAYHLWVHTDPGFRFPVGLARRIVSDTPIGQERQRPLG